MSQILSPSATRLLVGIAAAFALLFAAGSFTADAQALSRTQQAGKAAAQASFFCFAWRCQSRVRTGTAFSGSTLITFWRFNQPRGMLGHPTCHTSANVTITVTSGGAVRSRVVRCA
jgi:hypothetical protein